MKLRTLALWALVLALLGSLSGQSHAVVIGDLYNTGVDAFGNVLPDFIPDPHYNLVVVPGGLPLAVARTSAAGYPIPPYLPDNLISAWIGPLNPPATDLDGPVGLYTYQTKFDLTGFDPTTAFVSGQWSSDNEGIDILLNGVSIPNPFSLWPTPDNQFQLGYVPFSITSGFVAGVNTLEFVVNNAPYPLGTTGPSNPTALRVEILDTNVSAVPEAGSYAFAGIALCSSCGVYFFRRKGLMA